MSAATTAGPCMLLSLVVTTLGRTAEVERLFQSLARQSLTGFEVIVVDQNEDTRLVPVVERDWPFLVTHLHTPGERGASRGRNRGWRLCRGDVVLFPDDDSWFAPGLLAQALAALDASGCDILSGRATDEAGRGINGRWEAAAQRISRANIWTTAIEWMVFFRRSALEALDGFHENVGVGAATPWQSSEIQDILLRALKAGINCWYDPAVTGHHAEIQIGRPTPRDLRKARGYARGMGFVLREHGYGPLAIGAWILRPLAGAVLSLNHADGWRRLPYYGQVAAGRLEGALRRTARTG